MFIFDIDDTLYDNLIPFREALRTVPGTSELPADKLLFRFRRHSDEAFAEQEKGKMTVADTFIYRIREALSDYGIRIDRETAQRFQDAYEEMQGQIRLSEETTCMLDDLAAEKVKMGIISNGLSEHQRAKIEELGLKRWFHDPYILISEEAGASKPDPKIFRAAEKQMGISPEEAWYIGDSFEDDVTGAVRAGWKCIWMNRRKRALPEGTIRPDLIVETEEQLHRILTEGGIT